MQVDYVILTPIDVEFEGVKKQFRFVHTFIDKKSQQEQIASDIVLKQWRLTAKINSIF